MRKIYKKLTANQRNRSVIFSSCLSEFMTEQTSDKIHEVIKINQDSYKNKPTYELVKAQRKQEERIKNLKDDKFFNESHFKYNIIRSL